MILVTGSSGQLGTTICSVARSKGMEVVGLSRNLSKQENSENEIFSSEDLWPSIIRRLSPSTIICCDWEGISQLARENQELQARNSKRILSNVEAALEVGCKRIIGIGSQAEYGINTENKVQNELDPLRPVNHYGAEKVKLYSGISELVSDKEVFFNWLVPFSLYGGNERKASFVNNAIRQLRKGDSFQVHNPKVHWNFLHVSDFAQALLLILKGSKFSGRINIASQTSKTLLEYALEINTICGNFGQIISNTSLNSLQNNLNPSIDKILSMGWSEKIEFAKGVRMIIDELLADAQ